MTDRVPQEYTMSSLGNFEDELIIHFCTALQSNCTSVIAVRPIRIK